VALITFFSSRNFQARKQDSGLPLVTRHKIEVSDKNPTQELDTGEQVTQKSIMPIGLDVHKNSEADKLRPTGYEPVIHASKT
jgi:hypothetical protein